MTFPTYEEQIQSFPSELVTAFREARDVVAETLGSEEEFRAWADSGLTIARRAGRSWEAAKEYFRVSPVMLRALPFNHFQQWVYWGGALSEESPGHRRDLLQSRPGGGEVPETLGCARVGPDRQEALRRRKTVCCPLLPLLRGQRRPLSVLSFSEFQQLVILVEAVSEKSADEAINFLTLSRDVLPSLREDTRVLSVPDLDPGQAGLEAGHRLPSGCA